MRKYIFLYSLPFIFSTAHAQNFPTNYTPPWVSYNTTGNPADIVTSPEVATEIGKKVDATSGQAYLLNIHSGVIDGATTINGILASSFLTLDSSGNLDLPYATYGQPLSGSSLGTGAATHFAPNPVFQGNATIKGNAPTLSFFPYPTASPAKIWSDPYGNLQFSTTRNSSGFDFYTSQGKLNMHGTYAGDAAQVNLYAYGQSSPASVYQDPNGNLVMSPGSTNGSTTVYTNGSGSFYLYSSTMQLRGTSGTQLQFYSSSSSSIHGTMWQDSSNNLNLSTDSNGGALALYAATYIKMGSATVLPVGTPSSSSASCTQGQMSSDASYIYICTATNTWKRTALGSF